MPWSFSSTEMGAYALKLLLNSDEGLCPGSIFMLNSDEGLCPGLVPHAYKLSKMIEMLELHI